MLSEFERARIQRIFHGYCCGASGGDLGFMLLANAVQLFRLTARASAWDNEKKMLARFERNNAGVWLLYCSDPSGYWHRYQPETADRDIAKLLRLVAANPFNIFD